MSCRVKKKDMLKKTTILARGNRRLTFIEKNAKKQISSKRGDE